jgi:hypothetical protein
MRGRLDDDDDEDQPRACELDERRPFIDDESS